MRISNPINPETLTDYSDRLSSNRGNPYLVPNGYQLLAGLPVFGSYLCTGHPLPGLSPSLSSSTTSVTGTVLSLEQLLQDYYFTPNPSGPPCKGQPPLGTVTTGQNQSFPQLKALP